MFLNLSSIPKKKGNFKTMKSQNIFACISALLLIFSASLAVTAQNDQSDIGYVPEIGQPGKDVVWVPTPQELVDTMLSMAGVTHEDFVVDLGSGDGRTVISAAKRGAYAVGIEYNHDMVELSIKNAEKEGVSHLTSFIEADLFEYDLSKATVITMFLLPEINLKLRPKLLELKPGTRVVSNTFTMAEWEPDYEVTTMENWNSWNTALLWIIPAKAGGTWKLDGDMLSINQEFQMIYGKLTSGDKSLNIKDGRLRGEEITFKINDRLYTGRVSGDRMEGIVTDSSGEKKWSAIR
jgi:precorrin-6B methylase 2